MHEPVSPRRSLPPVNQVLQALAPIDLPRPVVIDQIRRELALRRKSNRPTSLSEVAAAVHAALLRHQRRRLQPVINGTGVILHTNFGRAPLGPEAAQALAALAAGYSNIEFDLETGARGARARYLEHHLALLCEAEAATVVNNCAAALVLLVHHFTKRRRQVIISRGELVQIGGGFRIGEMLEAAGAVLREVGATNRTALADYEAAIGPDTGLILIVHRSNFFMDGFVESTSLADLARLSRRRRIPLVADLGSGALEASSEFSDGSEPTPSDALKKGADLVCFSGDKLFGGPQAGIVAGRTRLIGSLRRDPIFRALRCDKLCLAALQATVDLHLRSATSEIPTLALLRLSKDELRARAAALFDRLRGLPLRLTIGRGRGKVGGGTLPRSIIPSVTLDLVPEIGSLEQFAAALRTGTPPIVGLISNNFFKLDLRTILPSQDEAVVDGIRNALARSAAEI